MTEIKFHPLNDQLLLKMDVRKKSLLEKGINDKPTLLPSGVVIAVGRGVFVPGKGWMEPQVKAGDHVAIILDGTPMLRMPIDSNEDDIYICVSESLLIGRLEGADEASCWWKAGDSDKLRLH
jgi:co-chaperonin GroES (HSP10)